MFYMGEESGNDDEKPVHRVSLDSFYIGKVPVTNEEFLKFLESSRYDFPRHALENPSFSDPAQPVTHVSWFDAIAYCEWIVNDTGYHFRLPTEAEWEYAARSGLTENTYPWGKKDWSQLKELHKCFQNGPEKVGISQPNGFGIQDMGMNVHEWCMDWYDSESYVKSPLHNPQGPDTGKRRSSRGGSWRHQIKITRCAARSSIPPEFRYPDYGFRVVREIK